MHLENIKIISETVNVNDGGSMRIDNSSIYALDSDNNKISAQKNALLIMENSSAVHEIQIHNGSEGEFQHSTTSKNLFADYGSTFTTDNMSMLKIYIGNNSTAKINNSMINCSAIDDTCVNLERMSSVFFSSSTITGGANYDAIKIGPTSQVNLYQSTVNSTKSSSIKVDGPLSYLDVYSSTINGTVSCGNIESHAFKAGTDLCN